MRITLFDSLRHVDHPTTVTWDWPTTVAFLSQHRTYPTKESAPGFGPYELAVPSRKTENVKTMAMAVFDVDHHCTPDRLAQCRELLVADDLAQHWYTTHSHSETKPSWRLVLPLDADWEVDEGTWKQYRLTLISRYAIPADPAKCSSRAHFYFVPSCLPNPTLPPQVLTYDGLPIQRLALVRPATRIQVRVPEPKSEPADLASLRRSLRARVNKLRGAGYQVKANALESCLDGEPLAEHGSRNSTALIVAGILAFSFPDEPVTNLWLIMRESVLAMQAAGSSLTEANVIGMLERSRRNYYAAEARVAACAEAWEKDRRRFDESTPFIDVRMPRP